MNKQRRQRIAISDILDRQRLVLSLVAVIVFLLPSYAGRDYELRGLTTLDGLSDLVVNTIYRDSVGFVYFGTDVSVERFDGVRIKSYLIPGPPGRLKRVNAIARLSSGELYCGNGVGLFCLDSDRGELIRARGGEIAVGVNDLEAKGDTLLIATGRGLYLLDAATDRLTFVQPEKNAFSDMNNILDVATSRDNPDKIWLSAVGGIHCYDTKKRSLTSWTYKPDPKLMFSSAEIIGDTIYLGTQRNGLKCFDVAAGEFSDFIDCGSNIVSSLSVTPDGKLFVGTDGNGVHLVDPSERRIERSLRHGGSYPSLRSNSVYSVLADSSGLFWIGYYQSGVDYTLFRRDMFDTYRVAPLLDTTGKTVRSLAIDGPVKLIGTREGLHYIDEERRLTRDYCSGGAGSPDMIFSILKYKGEYYVGTYEHGMYILNPSTLSLRRFSPGTPDMETCVIFSMAVDPAGQMWIGTDNGLYRYDGESVTSHLTTSNSSLPHNNVYEIFFDSTGTGWVCTENGVVAYSGGKLRNDRFPEGFNFSDKIREVYEDSENRLYFVPDRGYITRTDLTLGNVEQLVLPDVGTAFSPTFIVEDGEKGLWIGSSSGLCRLDTLGNYLHFSYPDGISNPSFTLCKPIVDEHGDIWMGNTDGLLRFDASNLADLVPGERPVVITAIDIDGEPVLIEENIVVPVDHNNLAVRFSDFSYTLPPYMTFEYTMTPDGETEKWNTLHGQSEIQLYNLSPGIYRLGIRRVGEPGSAVWKTVVVRSVLSGGVVWTLLIVLVLISAVVVLAWLLVMHRRRLKEAGKAEAQKKTTSEDNAVSDDDSKYRTTRLSDEECKRLLRQLNKIMKERQPFTNPDLKIGDLARMVGTSSHSLSFLFNQHMQSNYYDYVNGYRVDMFKRMVADGQSERYTLSALGEKCGFSSRASFFRFFKKMTGMAPGEYMNKVKSGEE